MWQVVQFCSFNPQYFKIFKIIPFFPLDMEIILWDPDFIMSLNTKYQLMLKEESCVKHERWASYSPSFSLPDAMIRASCLIKQPCLISDTLTLVITHGGRGLVSHYWLKVCAMLKPTFHDILGTFRNGVCLAGFNICKVPLSNK